MPLPLPLSPVWLLRRYAATACFNLACFVRLLSLSYSLLLFLLSGMEGVLQIEA